MKLRNKMNVKQIIKVHAHYYMSEIKIEIMTRGQADKVELLKFILSVLVTVPSKIIFTTFHSNTSSLTYACLASLVTIHINRQLMPSRNKTKSHEIDV